MAMLCLSIAFWDCGKAGKSAFTTRLQESADEADERGGSPVGCLDKFVKSSPSVKWQGGGKYIQPAKLETIVMFELFWNMWVK